MSAKETVLKLRIDTVLGDMSKAINGLQQGLEKGITKIDVGTSLGKSMSKNLQTFREEYSKFSQLTAGGTQVKVGNSKEAIQSGEKLIKVYRDIQAQVEGMGGSTTENLKKLFPDSFDGRIKEVRNSLASLQSSMLALDVKQTALTEATNEASRLKGELDGLNGQLVDTKDKITALENAEKALAAANADQSKAEGNLKQVAAQAEQTKIKFEQLRQEFVQKIDLNAAGVKKEIDDIEKEVNDLITKRKQLNKAGDAAGVAKIQKDIDAKNKAKDRKTSEYKKLTEASMGAMTAKDLKALSKQTQYAGIDPKQIEESRNQIQSLAQEQVKMAEQSRIAEEAVANARLKTKDATDQQKAAQDALDAANDKNEKTQANIDRTTKAYEQQKNKVSQLTTEIANMQTKMSTKGLADLKSLIPGFDEARLKTSNGIQGIITDLQEMDDQKAEKVRQELEKIATSADTVEQQTEEMKTAFHKVGESTAELSRAEQDLNMLKSRLEYFFGITNSIQLFKRAVTSALNTVKELDKTMTEAAVVTEFDVGDMWNKLPQYSTNAQRLGVSINSMYQATTLYYQQGLKTNKAMQLGIETMKMGKIAAMDSTEATKAMTAALRGFNMELNETSATRVNDVYSQLAAVTAADTNQIATAMEKTASIAASANMEFETTAALLAQIIETTQEAPETAGTAMKTIIARFAEVKSLREKGVATGQDEEGEGIDVNKIQTALRSVGISMEGFFAGTEGLHSILLKLAEKWGTLDFETQRYIATMAAGSRQQSRFIAMMSDYSRTAELVSEAQNSAGASSNQFEKTLDSMESKLQKLKNAWDQYLMGLTNNEILKAGIDSLTIMLETLNKITDAISGGNGLMKSIVSLTTVLGTLQLGRTLLPSILGSVSGTMGIGNKTTYTYDENDNLVSKSVTTRKQIEKGAASQQGGIGAGISRRKEGGKFWQRELTENEMATRRKGAIQGNKDWKNMKKNLIANNKDNPNNIQKGMLDKIRQGNVPLSETSEEYKKLNGVYEETIKNTGDAGKAMDATADEALKMGLNVKGAKDANIDFSKATKTTTFDTQAFGQMAMGAGAAVGGLAAILNATGNEDCQELAKWLSVASAALFGLGTVSNFVVPILSKGADALIAKGWSTQAAWWWLVGIIAIIAAVAAAFILLKKAADEASDTKQLEKLEKKLDDVSSAASRIKEELDDIVSSKKNLESLGETVSSLTENTREWRQALLENNEQVLALLDSYPELSQYLNRAPNGQLTITDEGWEKIETKKTEAYSANIASKALLANQVSQKRQEINTRLKVEEATNVEYGYGLAKIFGTADEHEAKYTGGLSYEDFTKFASVVGEMGVAASNFTLTEEKVAEALQRANVEEGVNEQVLQEAVISMGTSFDEIANQAAAAKEAEKARLQTTIDSIAATSTLVTNSEKFAEVVKEATANVADDYSQEVTAKAEKTLAILESESKVNQDRQEIIYSKYAEMAGYGDADQVKKLIESGEISKTEIAYALASEENNDKLVAQMEKLTKSLEDINRNNQKRGNTIKSLFSDEGNDLTMEQLMALQYAQRQNDGSFTISDFTAENIGQRLGISDKQIEDLYTGLGMSSIDEFVKYLNSQAKLAYSAYSSSLNQIELAQISLDDKVVAALSTGGAKGIYKNIDILRGSGFGGEQINEILAQVQGFINNQSIDEDVKQELFNVFAAADWTSVEELNQVGEIWANKIGQNTSEMTNLLSGIKELTNATSNLTQIQINQQGFAGKNIIEQIAKGEINAANMSTEDKDRILSILGGAYSSKFQQTGENTWAYLGDLVGDFNTSTDEHGNRINALDRQKQLYDSQENYEEVVGDTTENATTTLSISREAVSAYFDSEAYDPTNNPFQKEFALGNGEGAQYEWNQALMDYLTGKGNLTPEELWKKAKELGVATGEEQDFYTQLQANLAGVKKAAMTLGANGGGYENTTKNLTFEQDINDLIMNEGMYTEAANSGNSELKDRIYGVYANLAEATGETKLDKDEITIEQMYSEIKRLKQKYGTGQYTGVNASTARAVGAGVAADSGYASSYDFGTGEHGYEEESKSGFVNSINAMHSALGAAAFADTLEDTSKRMTNFAGTIKNVHGQTLDSAQAIKTLQVSMAQAYNRVKTMNEGFSKYKDILIASKRHLPEYSTALEQVKSSIASVFQVKESDIQKLLDEGIITKSDIENMVAGDSDSFDFIAKAISKQALAGYLSGIEDIKDQSAVIDLIMNASGNINLEEFQKQLADLGYNIDLASTEGQKELGKLFDMATKQIMIKTSEDGTISAEVVDLNTKDAFQNTITRPSGGGSQYKNSYDKFYNTYEKINALLREREQIERRYDKMLKNRSVNAKSIIENSKEELNNLEQERKLQEEIQKGKLEQIRELIMENSKYSDYVTGFDEKTGAISINWDALESLRNSSKGEAIEEYISALEGLRDQWQEAQDNLDGIEDSVEEIYDRGKDEYFDIEEQIKEAIVADRQKEIDKLSEINDSINDTSSKLLDSMQQQIDNYRQNRDNEKTEEEISDKQRRLAYLQQDTSGANATEIMQLQKEIDEAQEDYTDTLIDQKISELQQQNDEAAEQRQQQIDILQAQLDYDQESGEIWKDVNDLMKEGLNENSGLVRGSTLEGLLQSEAGFAGLSKLSQMNWMNELNSNIAKGLAWLQGGAVQHLFGEGGTVTFTNADNSRVSGTVNADGDVVTDDGAIYSRESFRIDANGNVTSSETAEQALAAQSPGEVEEEQTPTWPSGLTKPSQLPRTVGPGSPKSDIKSVQTALKLMGYNPGTVDGIYGGKTKAAIKKFQADAKTNGWNPEIGSPDGLVGPRTKKAFANHPYAFKTGGLADFTGPAWLDGTKSKPEYVLNADQTKAFFNLVDVLGSLQSGNSKTTQNNGDTSFDIDINVESIGSDYDVEQLADTVKRLINEDARYRNNNTINLMR